MNLVESKIKEVDKIIGNTTDENDLTSLKRLKEAMNTELTLKKKVMQDRFSKAMNNIRDYQDVVNKAMQTLAAVMQDSTSQKRDFPVRQMILTDLMSNNENADTCRDYY